MGKLTKLEKSEKLKINMDCSEMILRKACGLTTGQ